MESGKLCRPKIRIPPSLVSIPGLWLGDINSCVGSSRLDSEPGDFRTSLLWLTELGEIWCQLYVPVVSCIFFFWCDFPVV